MARGTQLKAVTVAGLVPQNSLGICLPHEHLLSNWLTLYSPPSDSLSLENSRKKVNLDLLSWLRFNEYSNEDNLHLDEVDMIVEEVQNFRNAGGQTLVDVTPIGMGRDVRGLRDLSSRTGANIIAGTGYYIASSHPSSISKRSIEEIKELMVTEIQMGIEGSEIRAGIIGEIGMSTPWNPEELKILQAGARAQKETGAPMSIHPGRSRKDPPAILNVLEKEGASLDRVVICHAERTIFELEEFESILNRKCFVEIDLFGYIWFPFDTEFPFPSDDGRIYLIRKLIEKGYDDQILISHDLSEKIHISRFGGFGLDHILRNVVPQMKRKGIGNEQIKNIIIRNPGKLLAFE